MNVAAANTLSVEIRAPQRVKFTTSFTPCEMIVRFVLGILATLVSLSFALWFSKVRNLFISKFVTQLPAIVVAAPPHTIEDRPADVPVFPRQDRPLEETVKNPERSLKSHEGELPEDDGVALSIAAQILASDKLSPDVEKSISNAIEKISPEYCKDMSPKIPGVEIYQSNLKCKVFSLDKYPGLIFKTGSSCIDRIHGYNASKKVCDEQKYDCVVLPKTRLHQIEGEDIIIQEKLDLLKSNGVIKYRDDREMDKAINQVSHFIFKVGYTDAHKDNLPFLKNEKKIGVVDFEFCRELNPSCCNYYIYLCYSHRKIFKSVAQTYDSKYF